MAEHYLRQFFVTAHLRPDLQPVAEPFAALAGTLDDELPNNPEKSAALRFLLQSKDCAVRAQLFKGSSEP